MDDSITTDDSRRESSSATARLVAASEGIAAKIIQNTTHVPWYLQHKSDLSESTQPTASGQDMPEMPEHSPELLEPVIKHVLNTLGLTHLTVLDLRRMTDPPPALGANLLMIIATARSERHLHASADKLCRWLRTEYKLSPFADGLLGRNEMKIAIRRRTKKAKMMSAVGAKAADSGDIADGLRSGWICVNVGRVEGGMLPDIRQAQADRNIVGFGTAFEGSTIVVQMMTEEKREEVDMEGLWDDALRRQERNNEAMARGIVEDNDNEAMSGGRVSSTTFSPF
ncbi:hypothetical protein AMS68_004654 [Peltaster fructicola]|uniref:ATPase synthesis protein 25 n=1 Tax=Peltaster fructicola TaxID=286661 RepID=A0A6H0XWJ7_9PEZI|nr:hypothetical protein AMS68_004654 [Peltaster fructicola]